MSIVYAITTGSYSDYRVERIFEARKDAETFVTSMGGGNQWEPLHVEEFNFHPVGDLPIVYTEYAVRCWPDRDEEIQQTSERTTIKPKHTPLEHISGKHTYFACLGPDKERCLKSVSDRVAKWKAEQAGIA